LTEANEKCPQCGHPLYTTRAACLYCGWRCPINDNQKSESQETPIECIKEPVAESAPGSAEAPGLSETETSQFKLSVFVAKKSKDILGKVISYIKGSLRLLKLNLIAFFPLIFCNLLVAQIGIVTTPLSFIIARYYAKSSMSAKSGKYSPLKRRFAGILYWTPIFAGMAVFLRMLFCFYALFILLSFAILVFLGVRRKWRKEAVAGLMLAVFFFFFTMPFGNSNFNPGRLKHERYVRPVYLFADHVIEKGKKKTNPPNGVRMIITSPDDSALYFTADISKVGAGKGGGRFKSMYRVSLLDQKDVRELASSDRIFGMAFMPGGDRLLATSFYEAKLLILDPATLKIMGFRKINDKSQFIIPDPEKKSVIVTYERNNAGTELMLPDLRKQLSINIVSSPGKIVVDYGKRVVFASNWMYPYLLTENSLSMEAYRKKFFLSGVSGGIDYDRRRDRIYISSAYTGWVYGVDRNTFEVVDKIKTLPFARAVCVDEKRRLILIGNAVDPYLRVYGYNRVLLAKIFIGKQCREIYQDGASGRIFVGTSLGVSEILTKDIAADFRDGVKKSK
jgi:hypothetical protein